MILDVAKIAHARAGAVANHANSGAGIGLLIAAAAVYVGMVAVRNQLPALGHELAIDLSDSGSNPGFAKWALALVVFGYITSLDAIAEYRGELWAIALFGFFLNAQQNNPALLDTIAHFFQQPFSLLQGSAP